MNIKMAGTHCPKCNVLEKKLNSKGISYEMIDDPDEVLKIGEQYNMNSAPILIVDDTAMDFSAANRWIAGV